MFPLKSLSLEWWVMNHSLYTCKAGSLYKPACRALFWILGETVNRI